MIRASHIHLKIIFVLRHSSLLATLQFTWPLNRPLSAIDFVRHRPSALRAGAATAQGLRHHGLWQHMWAYCMWVVCEHEWKISESMTPLDETFFPVTACGIARLWSWCGVCETKCGESDLTYVRHCEAILNLDASIPPGLFAYRTTSTTTAPLNYMLLNCWSLVGQIPKHSANNVPGGPDRPKTTIKQVIVTAALQCDWLLHYR